MSLILAVSIVPSVLVAGFQQWQKDHPRVIVVDEAAAERQIADDPSICDLDGFPADRSKAMARAQCWIDKVKAENSNSDIIEAYMIARRAVAERYVNGEITADQAEEAFVNKKIAIANLAQQREAAAAEARSETLRARAAIMSSLQQVPLVQRLGPKSIDCANMGTMTHCDEY